MTPESEKIAVLLGRRLNALRKKMELKQSAFAHLMGTSDETLCVIEKGRKLPGLKMLCALSEQLEMTLSELLNFRDAPKTRPTANQPLKTFILYLKTKSPAEVRMVHDMAKSVLNKAPAIYLPVPRPRGTQTGQKPGRSLRPPVRSEPFAIRDK